MALEEIRRVTGRAVAVPGDDIDTDQIIPARFMRCVTFDGLGEHLFRDARFSPSGAPTDHPLNDPRRAGATILVVGGNFGCGSSREHAPQAIRRYGFRAVVGASFAEIFFGNATALGIPCVTMTHPALDQLRKAVEDDPAMELELDLEAGRLRVTPDGRAWPINQPATARQALLTGRWDPIGDLFEGADAVAARAAALGYANP